jgi:2-isopropylmalate synthase
MTQNYHRKLKVFDTTLRDGNQSSDVNFSIEDKLEILRALDDFGIDYIEFGWPGSNKKDMEAFLKARNRKIVAFGSTRRKNIKANQDQNLNAIIKSKAPIACIFGKNWLHHVEKQLKMTEKENLAAIYDSISFLRSQGIRVLYDAEHFFDGFKDNERFSLACLKTAAKAGAECIILCDTNGGTLPGEFEKIVEKVIKNRRAIIKTNV